MKKKIVSAILVIAMALTTTLSITTLASSNPSSWAVEEVNAAINAELVTDSVMADYQANITREQFCEMVVKAYEKISGEDAEAGNIYFSDTSNVEILKAANLGIVTGYGNNVFGSNDLITREQIATMLVRMIDKSVPYANINVYNDNCFKDKNSISDWAIPSINFAYDKGIIQGVGDNCIDPPANTTCEQAILLIYRTVDKYYDEEAQLDSIYELTEEHIAQDDETFVHYTDNIVLAFIERGLSEDEKEDIADIVGGKVVAQLAGSINILQIEVEASTLDELDKMTEDLMDNINVYYATADVLIDESLITYDTIYTNSNDVYNVNDEWWTDAIDVDYVWNNYDSYIGISTVGVIDSGIRDAHEDLENKITFVTNYHEQYNQEKNDEDTKSTNHGTGVTSIITANNNGIGITGIANKSNVTFAPKDAWLDNWKDEIWGFDYYSALGYIYALKKEVEAGAKVINNSYGQYYLTEKYYNNHKDEFEFTTYERQKKYNDLLAELMSIYTTSAMCELINNDIDFIAVQSAGNGENNSGPGVNASLGGFWRGITKNNSNIQEILNRYNISYDELMEHIIIVGAVKNDKEGNDYLMTDFSNYGNVVDICAPGENIKVCNSTGTYTNPDKKVFSTWYNPSSGTSEAAPMVTGTAALLWGIDPTLKAAEVKGYIINGSKCKAIGVTGEDAGREYPMLNVRGAVEELLKIKKAVISVTDKNDGGRISDATISYGNGLNKTTDMIGNCDIYLVSDNHEITISKEGYKTVTVTVEDKYIGQNGEWADVKEILLEKDISDEDKLLNAFIEQVVGYNSDYLYFLPDDYDCDGTLEAFGITGSDPEEELHSNVEIWFINSEGNCTQLVSDSYGSLHSSIDTGNGKFIVWEKTAGGSGSASYIYGYSNGLVYEPEISGYYEWFRCDNGKYLAEKGDFSKGYHDWITYEFIYDSESKEFIKKI